jgi:hypothetical protein
MWYPSFEGSSVGGGGEGDVGGGTEGVEPLDSAVKERAGYYLVEEGETEGSIIDVVLIMLRWGDLLPEGNENFSVGFCPVTVSKACVETEVGSLRYMS